MDRLLYLYGLTRDGHLQMRIGLKEFRDINLLGLWSLLKIPFAPYRVRSNRPNLKKIMLLLFGLTAVGLFFFL
ncbi:MAG: hypothetical protein MZV70_17125 [Desulfobacterales bacterium]|nr:hypothetical protein [Desulfobacterales bacterium]